MMPVSMELLYHSRKMLLTVDLNKMFEVVLEEYGAQFSLAAVPMTAEQRNAVEDNSGPVTMVCTRFMLFETRPGTSAARREDLELRVINERRKF